ncbi:MAG: DUF3887 domain-containing protein [Bacteroidales bacterium]|nr:DUF3887 domain-containing protein [Bacteroidales bacterium]
MKTKLIFVIFISFIGMSVFSQNQFQKLNEKSISETDMNFAVMMAKNLLEGQKSSNIYLLDEDEATREMVKNLTETKQTTAYEHIKDMFGDFESIEFTEVWESISDKTYTIFRFRGEFSESQEKPEIRIVLNEAGKLSGFWIRQWKDEPDNP